ncbi:hypothetical protein Tco_1391847 [Tanacetum coccineum]
MKGDKIKKDLEEIETINMELDHRVSKLIAENEHLKQTYKQLYDSIKPASIRSKEQSFKNELRKLKGKAIVDNVVTKQTIDPEMLKIDVEPITPKLITTIAKVPLRKLTALKSDTPKPVTTLVYSRKPRKSKTDVPVSKPKIVLQIILWYLDSGYSKHITRDCSQLTNFVNKFLGTFKFRNDHVANILGYGDYHIRNVTISRVYYVEGLGHNLFFVGQFCDSNLEVAFRQHTCFICNLEGVNLLTGSRGNNLYTLSIGDMMSSSPICLLSKASKTNENLGKLQPKADIGIFIGYAPTKKAFRIYNRCTRRIIKIIQVDFDELTAMASKHISSGPVLHDMTPATISSGLVPNPHSSTPFVPPSRTPEVITLIDEVVAPVPAVSTGSPSSTTVDQDASSPSNSQTTPETQSPILPNDVEEDWKRISKKNTKNQAKTDKTEHKMEKREKTKSNRSQKVNPRKSKLTPTKSKPRSNQVKDKYYKD